MSPELQNFIDELDVRFFATNSGDMIIAEVGEDDGSELTLVRPIMLHPGSDEEEDGNTCPFVFSVLSCRNIIEMTELSFDEKKYYYDRVVQKKLDECLDIDTIGTPDELDSFLEMTQNRSGN